MATGASRFIGGCTIGAKVFEPGKWFVLFKNKDFKRERFEDELLIEKDLFGIRGVESWAAPNGEISDTFSGFSLGINSSLLFLADANIKSLARKRNYDVLTEHALRNASEARQVQGVLSREIPKGYGWTNMVAVDGRDIVALEVGNHVNVERGKKFAARTNHFLLTPGWKVDYHQDSGTKTRMRDASTKLREARNLQDIFELLKTHRSLEGATSVCNHGTLHTVYSYVFEMRDGKLSLNVAQGNPCQNDYVKVDISFPITESVAERILEVYPSRASKKRLGMKVPILAR